MIPRQVIRDANDMDKQQGIRSCKPPNVNYMHRVYHLGLEESTVSTVQLVLTIAYAHIARPTVAEPRVLS